LSGNFQDLILIGCLVASLWRAAEHFGPNLSPTANRVALIAFILYLAVGYRMHEKVGLSGDEPHYLLIAYSILHDRDLAVENNYEAEDARHFFQGTIGPHLVWGLPYSVHGVGLPLILLPGFALLGLWGVLLTQALMGSLLAREVFRAAEHLTDRTCALAAAVGFCATSPALFQCVSAYPEVPAALVTAWSFRRIVSPTPPSTRGALIWGLGLGLLPLFHVKFVSLAAVLALGAWIRWSERRWMLVAGGALGLACLLLFFLVILDPNVVLLEFRRQHVFWNLIPAGLAGLLFDRAFGLLAASPFYIIAIAGVGKIFRERPFAGLLLLAIFAAMALPAAAHPAWWAGSSPSARYIFPALPVLAVSAAFVWGAESLKRARWPQTLLLISLCFSAYMALGPGQPLYLNPRGGAGRLWESLGNNWDLTHYFPSMLELDLRSVAMAVVASVLLIAAIVVQASGRRLKLAPPWLAILLGAWLIDFTSAGKAPEGSQARWTATLLKGLPGREDQSFLLLPSAKPVAYPDILAKVELPLGALEPKAAQDVESPLYWESSSVYLPAGQYTLLGDSNDELLLCNGEGCFSSSQAGGRFTTRVNLDRFRVRANTPLSRLRVKVSRLEVSPVHARRSLLLASGVRLHSLDDNAYLDPRGYWVHGGSRARFVVEGRGPTVLSLANGAQENWVEAITDQETLQFALRPRAAKRLTVALVEGITFLSVESASGFRPAEFDSGTKDRRLLGVFLTSPRTR
jgi:hypothetical protein